MIKINEINAYDFDGTIYDGESSLDFYLFCLRRHPTLIRFSLVLIFYFIKYKLRMVSEEQLLQLCEKHLFAIAAACPDAEELTNEFWKKHEKKIKPFYTQLHKEDDLIISASFGFYLRPIMGKLKVNNLLCSEVDLEKGEITRLCYRKHKARLFEENYPNVKINKFYTDSLNDLPMMAISNESFMVKGEKIEKYILSQEN